MGVELTLFVFFLAVALCFFRAPQGDRWHVLRGPSLPCFVVRWPPAFPHCGRGRTPCAAGSFLILGLFQVARQRERVPR